MTTEATTRAPTFIQLTTSNGPLAQIWLASNMSHSLSRTISQQTDIIKSVEEIAKVAGCSLSSENIEPITLRASGELLHGVVRVYSRKTSLLLNDIKDTLSRMTSLFKSAPVNLIVQMERTTLANPSHYLLQDAVTEREVLQVPGLEFLGERTTSKDLMENERSMERHVQGAAQWDSSIELGRNIRPTDELGFNQSSILDLDFDIDDTATKAVGEGTNTSISKSAQTTGSALIQEDDFSGDEHLDWDLGFRDESANLVDEPGSDKSVEVGRRASLQEPHEEHTEFDFDLGLDKVDDERPSQEGEDNQALGVPVTSPPPSNHPVLPSRLRPITTDEDTELRDEIVKVTQLRSDLPDAEIQSGIPHISRKPEKRVWTQIVNKFDFIPDHILKNLLPYQNAKRPRVSNDVPEIEADPQFSSSLEIGEDLITDFENNTGHPDDGGLLSTWDDGQDQDMEIEDNLEVDNGVAQSISAANSSSLESHAGSDTAGNDLPQGVDTMAGQLRAQFTGHQEISFFRYLENRAEAPPTRKEASKAFLEILTLATMDCVHTSQQRDFEDIMITAKASLYSNFIDI
ncbi:LADA_0F06282g1_1 [Lachancea dasiensis]|uniref:LADA_0F06282g1_1 n=1 Tax=Lachancea dasiensis TaxID=1072105 RepID=A0A1G4JK96_9SACH|nr:LADA_0F06282g1_1 [Lachancea dasiensis]